MGVSGSGKTTVGELLAVKIGIPFFDADDFHSQANKEKMKAGLPLNDKDRENWLQNINQLAIAQQQLKGAVIACSALKEKYRTVLGSSVRKPLWVFLQGNYDMIFERLKKRRGHYMPASLLQSQFESLEIPADAITVGIEKEPVEIVELIYKRLNAV